MYDCFSHQGIIREVLECECLGKSLDHITQKLSISCRNCNSSSMQAFCWKVVGDLCKGLIRLCEAQHFPEGYKDIFISIGRLYKQYCHEMNPRGKYILVNAPQNASQQIKVYFQWIHCMHNFIVGWRDRFSQENVTHDDMAKHRSQYNVIRDVMTVLGFDSLVIEKEKLKALISKFIGNREKVNSILIRKQLEDGKILW